MLSLPLFAQADCPPSDSIDRYAQTAGDALTALHELVPESQQQALEDRYSAMIVLKWQWQGRDAIRADERAVTQLLGCYQDASCGIRANDQITTQIVAKLEESNVDPLLLESLLPQQPTPRTLAWAERILGCNAPAQTPAAPLLQDAPIETANTQSSQAESVISAAIDPQPQTTAQRPVQQGIVAQNQPTNTASIEPVITTPSSIIQAEDTLEPQFETASRAVAQSSSANVNELMLTATSLVSSGKPQEAIEPLEAACFIEAQGMTKSSACETLFSVYTNSLVASEYSESSQSYLDLSQRLCDIGYSRGCDNLSRYHAAQSSAEAHRAAVAYAEKSCDLANA
ncbi:MAG: hypothetical protein AAGA89_09285, partial [Pseudomonadota bacterium]